MCLWLPVGDYGNVPVGDYGNVPIGDYGSADGVYEDIQDLAVLKRTMVQYLREYNDLPGVVSMDLVLFKDAIEHGPSSVCTSHALSL